MNNTMGLYRVTSARLIRMRRAYRHNASWVHVTTDGPDTLRAPALCRSDSNGGPWYWTDDNISCSACLHAVRAGLGDGSFILATPAQVAALRREVRRKKAPAPKNARAAAIARGVRPATGSAWREGTWTGDGASGAAGDGYVGAGCPSLASIALVELAEDEHYPNCDFADGEDPDGGFCTCYGDERSERDYYDLSPEWTL